MNPQTPLGVWQGRFTELRVPMLYNLRADPFERGPESIYYGDWTIRRAFVQVPIQGVVAQYIESFKDFPPRAKAASFTVNNVMEKIQSASPSEIRAGVERRVYHRFPMRGVSHSENREQGVYFGTRAIAMVVQMGKRRAVSSGSIPALENDDRPEAVVPALHQSTLRGTLLVSARCELPP